MLSFNRLLGWIVAVQLALISAPALAESQHPQTQTSTEWAHPKSDLKPDPRIRFGQIANGMRYAIMKTNRPERHIAIRLRIAVGSLNEANIEQGLAHYLEHIAFQGSKSLSRNELVQTLQRMGLAFGADTNARTQFDQTVYMLNLPRSDAETFISSLNLLREMADRLTISEDAVQKEKGVILSEERVRDTPSFRALKSLYTGAYRGLSFPNRFPIGTTDVIKAADAKILRSFYQRYYRPERALLVITGDIDPDAIESQVKATFADWTQPEPAGHAPTLGTLQKSRLHAHNAVDPSFSDSVILSWMSEEPMRQASRESEEINIRRSLATRIVNTRLQRLAQKPAPQYTNASIGCENFEQSRDRLARRCSLGVTAGAAGWSKAMQAAERDLRQSVVFAPDSQELDRVLKSWRASLDVSVKSADTPGTPQYAEAIVAAYDNRTVLLHPKDYVDLWSSITPKITPNDIRQSLVEMFGGPPTQIFAQTPKPVVGGTKALLAAYENGRAVAVGPAVTVARITFPYTEFGTHGVIESRKNVADLGVTQVTFKNGVRLNIRPSTEESNIVRVTIRFDGGILAFPANEPIFESGYQTALIFGGLGKMKIDELREALAGRNSSTAFDFDTADYLFEGYATREDLLLHFQTVAAYMTDPAYRPEALERAKADFDRSFQTKTATAGNVLNWELPVLLASGDRRWAATTRDQAHALSADDIRAKLTPIFENAPIEITIVGDTTPDEAIAAVATTLAALPQRRPPNQSIAPSTALRYPDHEQSVQLSHDGRADQSLIYLAWPTFDFYSNPRRARAGALVESVLDTSLTEALRDQGLTYGVNTSFVASEEVAEYGYLSVQVEAKPETLATVKTTIDAQVQKIIAGSFSNDLLARARQPEIAARESQAKANSYWVSALADSQSKPGKLDAIRSRIQDIKTVTREEITAAAKQIFNQQRQLQIRILPKLN